MNSKAFVVTSSVVALLFGALFGVMLSTPSVEARPMAAPTPVAGTYTGAGQARVVTLFDSDVATSTAQLGQGVSVLSGDRVDLQVVIDQPTSVNTTTLKLQFSNDLVNWVDGATVLTDNAADANVMQQYSVFGAYARLHVAGTNTEPVSVKVVGVVK